MPLHRRARSRPSKPAQADPTVAAPKVVAPPVPGRSSAAAASAAAASGQHSEIYSARRGRILAVDDDEDLVNGLAEVLDTIARVVRERNQVRQQVKALSAEGRYSAYILIALPVGLFFYIQIVNPDYGQELLRGGGLIALITGIVLIFLGGIWMRNLTKLEY